MAQQTIVAYFDSRSEAEIAQAALAAEGINAGSIQLLPAEGSTYARGASETSYDHRRDEGGFWASLGDSVLPDEDRYTYAEGMSRGGVTLTVTTDETHYDRVASLLERNGAVDLDAREAEWRQSGWTGFAAARTAGTETVANDGTIQVVEEQLRVGKRLAEAGRVRVRSYVVETPVEADIELRSQHVTIERRPVDRPATTADLTTGERTIEAVERREEAVVGKEARVVEEIGLRPQAESHTETVRDTVRKTEVEIEDERLAAERLRDGTTTASATGSDTSRTTR